MPERPAGKPEIAAQKRSLKLAPAIGDWTTYKPPKVLVKKVKTGLYGFDRLSKEDLSTALLIHYRFLELLLKHFKIDLKMAVELFSVNVEQTTYLNHLRTLASPLAQLKISLPDCHDNIAFVLDLPLANSLINYALGSHDLEQLNRGLTQAENTTLTASLTEYLSAYTAAWERIIASPVLSIIGSPDVTIDPAVNTSATFVSLSAEVSLADQPPGRLVIGYLATTLKRLLAQYKQHAKQQELNFNRLGAVLLNKIIIPSRVTLGQTYLTTREINQLEIGDVVTLDTAISAALPLEIGQQVKIPGQPGLENKKLSVRIAGAKDEVVEVEPPPVTAVAEPKLPQTPTALPAPLSTEAPVPSAPPLEEAFKEDFLEEDYKEDGLLDEAEFDEDEFLDEEGFPEK